MSQYKTKQRSILISYLNAHTDQKLSAFEIAQALKPSGISRSAVYRNLQYLCDEGTVKKYAESGTRESYYRFSGSEECKGCLHLQCVKCGKTTHMKKAEVSILKNSLDANDNFDLSLADTVLYGVCRECK